MWVDGQVKVVLCPKQRESLVRHVHDELNHWSWLFLAYYACCVGKYQEPPLCLFVINVLEVGIQDV